MLHFPFWSSGQSFEQIFLQNSFIWKCDCKTSHSTTVPVCIIHTYRCLLLWFPMHGRSTYSKLADSFLDFDSRLWLHVASPFCKKQTWSKIPAACGHATMQRRGVPPLHALPSLTFAVCPLWSASVFYWLVCLSPKLALSQSDFNVFKSCKSSKE